MQIANNYEITMIIVHLFDHNEGKQKWLQWICHLSICLMLTPHHLLFYKATENWKPGTKKGNEGGNKHQDSEKLEIVKLYWRELKLDNAMTNIRHENKSQQVNLHQLTN